MFEGCKAITSAPVLPARGLGIACYKAMFKGCEALANVPSELPAPNNITESCYESMFEGCESLTTAPTVPIDNKPAVACFRSMFKGCKALANNIPDHFQGGKNIKE